MRERILVAGESDAAADVTAATEAEMVGGHPSAGRPAQVPAPLACRPNSSITLTPYRAPAWLIPSTKRVIAAPVGPR